MIGKWSRRGSLQEVVPMMEGSSLVEVIKIIFLWLNPLIFLVGIMLVVFKQEKFNKMEKSLKENVETFQKWMLKRKNLVGLVFIVYSIISFYVLMML
jgi:hypothetical protein